MHHFQPQATPLPFSIRIILNIKPKICYHQLVIETGLVSDGSWIEDCPDAYVELSSSFPVAALPGPRYSSYCPFELKNTN